MIALTKKIFILKSDATHIQFFRYLFVGGASTIVDMGAFFIVVNTLHFHYLIAQTISFLFGLIINYILSIFWVFSHTGNFKKEFALFAIIGIGGLLLSYLFLWLLIDISNLHTFKDMLAKAIAVLIVLFWNFGMRKKFVF
ncbi:MAG: hypothetical protein UT50_C0001G0077 [Candidatus Moranbacteria bacterium GW2011_GWA2_39_41]|nr:MAG: hypothetical protein UT50_C0001G0077 [Candidatus Moranbacteria bacterium GW2011_GWA2_39_41]